MTVDRSDIVQIEMPDENPDLSWLGKYTDEAPTSEDVQRGSTFIRRFTTNAEYDYFIPATGVVETVEELQKMGFARGPSEELARKQCRRDYERMESFGTQWSMICIQAQIELHIPVAKDHSILQTITSPGLWGVESDSGDEYIKQVFDDETRVLVDMLTMMGITVEGPKAR